MMIHLHHPGVSGVLFALRRMRFKRRLAEFVSGVWLADVPFCIWVGCLTRETQFFSPLLCPPSVSQPDFPNDMVRRTRSMTTLNEPEDVQMHTDTESQVEKRGHSTETDDTPRKRAKDQGHEVDGVPGKKVQCHHIQVFKADHKIRLYRPNETTSLCRARHCQSAVEETRILSENVPRRPGQHKPRLQRRQNQRTKRNGLPRLMPRKISWRKWRLTSLLFRCRRTNSASADCRTWKP
jgi:hypothetical protein